MSHTASLTFHTVFWPKLDFDESFILTAPTTNISGDGLMPDVADAICTYKVWLPYPY